MINLRENVLKGIKKSKYSESENKRNIIPENLPL